MRPLEGIKVLDLSRVLAGPYCTMILGDLGAEVIKVEKQDIGDDSRKFGPFVKGRSAYFLSLNRNKKSVSLDLKSKKGKERLAKLIKWADVLVENFRPGVLDKLGFPWEHLKKINPSLVCCRISGFGQTGHYKDRPAYDIIIQSMGGIMSVTGQNDGVPTRVGVSIGDIAAGLFSVIGILSALRVKDVSGKGQEIDISMLDCQIALLENSISRYMATGVAPKPIGNRHPSISPFTAIATKDKYIVIAAGNNSLWEKLCQILDARDLLEDSRFKTNEDRTENWEQLELILNAYFTKKASETWLDLLVKAGIPCGPLYNIENIIADPQVKHRKMILSYEIDGESVSVSGMPIKFSLTPAEDIYLSPPELGQHNLEIFSKLDDINNKTRSKGL